MRNIIKAVIWDMGGVLFRIEDHNSRKILAEKHNLTPDSLYSLVFRNESAALATLGVIDEEQHWLNVGQSLNLIGETLTQFRTEFWAVDKIDRELIKFIDSLNSEYKTGLLSNAFSGARKALDEIYHCIDVFQYSIFSAEVGLAKPDPAIYNLMLAKMDVEPTQAIFVDDVQDNIDAAICLGIHGIRFINSEQVRNDVLSLL